MAKGVDNFGLSCVLFICGRAGCVADTTYTSTLVLAYTYVQTCTNIYKHVQTCAYTYKHVSWSCANMVMYVRGYVVVYGRAVVMSVCIHVTWLCPCANIVMYVCGYVQTCTCICVHVMSVAIHVQTCVGTCVCL